MIFYWKNKQPHIRIENDDINNPIIEYVCFQSKVVFQLTNTWFLVSTWALGAPQNLTLSDITKNRESMTSKKRLC